MSSLWNHHSLPVHICGSKRFCNILSPWQWKNVCRNILKSLSESECTLMSGLIMKYSSAVDSLYFLKKAIDLKATHFSCIFLFEGKELILDMLERNWEYFSLVSLKTSIWEIYGNQMSQRGSPSGSGDVSGLWSDCCTLLRAHLSFGCLLKN